MYGGRLWSQTSSLYAVDLTDPVLEVCGPIPDGSELVAVSLEVWISSVAITQDLFCALAGTDQADVDALQASQSLFNRTSGPVVPYASGLQMRLGGSNGLRQVMPVGIAIRGGSKYVLFGLRTGLTHQGTMYCSAWIWTPDRGPLTSVADEGSVLDRLRGAATGAL